MEAAEVISAVRRRQGLTQAELALRAGTAQSVISAYEHGRRDPSISTLRRLVAAGGERLRIDAAVPRNDEPPIFDEREHARRLFDVLTLVDALPPRRQPAVLVAPRIVSR